MTRPTPLELHSDELSAETPSLKQRLWDPFSIQNPLNGLLMNSPLIPNFLKQSLWDPFRIQIPLKWRSYALTAEIQYRHTWPAVALQKVSFPLRT